MDSTLTLFGYFLNLTLIAAFGIFCFKFFNSHKNSGHKNQILNLNAKLSMLRMTLKAKIKTKSHKYRSLFKVGITSGDPVDLALNELISLSLENGDDLQRYFDISKRINSLLIAEGYSDSIEKKEAAAAQGDSGVGKEDFMGTDFKSEIAILRLIKEMVEISQHLNKKIEAYNLVNPKNPIAKVNVLNFPSLAEVNRVFANSTVSSDAA